jgi:hypothetical protein
MDNKFNLFISWSGERSKLAASALRDWLPLILQSAKPWMSESDIDKGTRGLVEIAKALEGIRVGITCLTPENLRAPWILYEAGALSKTVDDKTRLCTYLLAGLQPQDVEPPLGMFQATKGTREDTLKLLKTINVAISAEPLTDERVNILFERLWPDLEKSLLKLPPAKELPRPQRTTDEMVAEILELVRAQAQSTSREATLRISQDALGELLSIRDVGKATLSSVVYRELLKQGLIRRLQGPYTFHVSMKGGKSADVVGCDTREEGPGKFTILDADGKTVASFDDVLSCTLKL